MASCGVMAVDSSNLDDLKQRRQWLVWHYETTRDGKQTKVPYSPITGCKTGSDELHRGEWVTYDEAVRACENDSYSGVGIVLTDGLNGIDIDHRALDDGITRDVLSKVCSFAERSPSGEGLHILFTIDPGKLPDGFLATYKDRYYSKNTGLDIECYLPSMGGGARYFTFTDDVIVDQPINDCTESVLDFLGAYMRKPEPAARAETHAPRLPAPAYYGVALTDDEVIAKARTAKNGDRFARLWGGDTSDHNDDDSAADLALCSHLAYWCGGDTAQMDRLFRQSGLMRDKWDRDDYRESTISKAIEGIPGYYNPAALGRYANNGFGEAVVIGGLVERLRSSSDDGFSDLFIQEYGDRIRHSEALGWLVWNGQYWEPSHPKAQELFKEFAARFEADVKALHASAGAARTEAHWDGDKALERGAKDEQTILKAQQSFSKSMRTASKIKGCMSLASSAVHIEVDELDSDPYLLNTPTGIVDLRTGELMPHDPSYYCAKMTKYAPTDSTDATMWSDLLDIVTCGDVELAEYLQYVAGMALVGKTYQEVAFIAHGGGANGKSTFFNALSEVFGNYSGKLSADALISTRGDKRFDLAGLMGKRLVIASETEEGQSLSNSMLKQIASTDTITTEKKYKDRFEFEPSFVAVLYTNFLPKVRSSDNGTWRRIKVIPFNATIANPAHDYLERLLERSGGAILNWAIEGARKFIDNGLELPRCEAVEQATEGYRADNDWLSHFVDECCIVDERATCMAGDLYGQYQTHAEKTGEYQRNSKDFKAALVERGYEHGRASGGRGNKWIGIKPRESGAQ